MFKPGDVVARRDGQGESMTVEKVEKCLDCTGIIVSCVWIPLIGGAQRAEFPKGKLDLIRAAPAPRRGDYDRIFERERALENTIEATFIDHARNVTFTLANTDGAVQGIDGRTWIIENAEPLRYEFVVAADDPAPVYPNNPLLDDPE
jgi:hypothetical protein